MTYLLPMFLILLGGFLIHHSHYRVAGTSMSPTFRDGQHILVNPWDRDPVVGEVLVLRAQSRTVVKRLVAVAGDTVAIRAGVLWVNDRPQHEPYIAEVDPYNNFPQVIVPPGHLFVLGDNRLFTTDSRHFGSLSRGAVIGNVLSN